MKIVLREKGSGLYFKSPSGWTVFLQEALDFKKLSQAVQFAHERALMDVAVFLEVFGSHHSIFLADCDVYIAPTNDSEKEQTRVSVPLWFEG